MLASVLANFEYEANTTAGNGNYFVNLVNVLFRKLVGKTRKIAGDDSIFGGFFVI